MQCRWCVVGLALALLIVSPIIQAPPASAANFHGYSIAMETSASGSYDGGIAYRHSWAFATSCAYEPLWLNFTNGNGWVEIGLSHSCIGGAGVTAVYTYVSEGGFSGFVGTTRVAADGSRHYYKIQRSGSSVTLSLDGTCTTLCSYVSLARAERGRDLQAGLESYDANANIGNHTVWNLQRYVGGSWAYWAGYDNKSVDAGMCGGWNNQTTWRMAENNPC